MSTEKRMESLRLSNEESNRITKECLQSALIMLLSEKSLDKISITELVARAGVSRTSFYRNYSEKEDILVDAVETVGHDLKKMLNDEIQMDNWKKMYFDVLSKIKINKPVIRLIIKADLLRYISKEVESLFDSIFRPVNNEEKYVLSAYCGAAFLLAYAWFENGMVESAEEMSVICDRNLSHYYEKLIIMLNRQMNETEEVKRIQV